MDASQFFLRAFSCDISFAASDGFRVLLASDCILVQRYERFSSDLTDGTYQSNKTARENNADRS